MKKDNISTQTLLEILLNEMEHVREYTKLIKSIGPDLNNHLDKIRSEKIEMNTTHLEKVYDDFNSSAKEYVTIPRWFLIIAAFAFISAIAEGLFLYYLVYTN